MLTSVPAQNDRPAVSVECVFSRLPVMLLASWRLTVACMEHGVWPAFRARACVPTNFMAQAAAGEMLKQCLIACRFFALPLATKQSAKRSMDNSMGFFNDEFTKQKMDLKEGFDFRHVQVGEHQTSRHQP